MLELAWLTTRGAGGFLFLKRRIFVTMEVLDVAEAEAGPAPEPSPR